MADRWWEVEVEGEGKEEDAPILSTRSIDHVMQSARHVILHCWMQLAIHTCVRLHVRSVCEPGNVAIRPTTMFKLDAMQHPAPECEYECVCM